MDRHKEHKAKDRESAEAKEHMLKKDFDSSDEDLEKKMKDERASDERRKSYRREADRIADEEKTNAMKENLKLRGEMDVLKDTMMRRQADFENYKKRMAKQQGEYRKMVIRDFAQDIIQINDDLLRAIEASNGMAKEDVTEDTYRSFVDGVSMISDRIESTMGKYGVTEIDALDQEFDPNFHEAVEIETNGEAAVDTVSKVYQKGFRIDDLVVRSAKVRVTKAKKADAPAEPAPEEEESEGGDGESAH
ncbi:MAG: nucleotide exchange factor GrpE [Spirochaetes bacterium]|nr:nucleotide exchange factor GrpE [Spirochaetota bacterium]